MFYRILILTVVLKVVVFSLAAVSEDFEVDPGTSGNARFFEIPCMAIGGVCARSVACPKGTKVGQRGLCPVQQDLGMECCKPPNVNIECKAKGGKCLSTNDFKCPRALKIEEATDCQEDETCCGYQ